MAKKKTTVKAHKRTVKRSSKIAKKRKGMSVKSVKVKSHKRKK